ncbi:hypothetical protein ABE55_06140 [Bacillus thuringiensis]|uniref:hypothetical protein n=1 Tax=Bacillus TaxID=1386 RepID=UPI0005321EDB|nr:MULTISPECIES: hypothetical protein [Bacillus cereus group]KGT40929.1 hypothetical protein IY08_25795 [Bacillus cereus]KXZ01973.1 hypothetical protein AT281_27730 [Bacillus cereus]MBG9466115.1 hypothetical protein [Bacillus thuringiensis]PET57362.1 holin [Bacillus cereus]PFQ13877.1 holin [Bacillus cereus]
MIELGFIAALIVGLNEMAKRYEYIPKRFLPLSSVLLGILAMFLLHQYPISESIFIGIAIGLSANGLFDMSKLVTKRQ